MGRAPRPNDQRIALDNLTTEIHCALISFGWAAAQGIALRRPYYFIELADVLTSPWGVILYERLPGVCGSIDEDLNALADSTILGVTPDVRYWWKVLEDGSPPTIGLTDIEGHWKRFTAVMGPQRHLDKPIDPEDEAYIKKVEEIVNELHTNIEKKQSPVAAAASAKPPVDAEASLPATTGLVPPLHNSDASSASALHVASKVDAAQVEAPRTVAAAYKPPPDTSANSAPSTQDTTPSLSLKAIRDRVYEAYSTVAAHESVTKEALNQALFRETQLRTLSRIWAATTTPWTREHTLTEQAHKAYTDQYGYSLYKGYMDLFRGLPGAVQFPGIGPTYPATTFHNNESRPKPLATSKPSPSSSNAPEDDNQVIDIPPPDNTYSSEGSQGYFSSDDDT